MKVLIRTIHTTAYSSNLLWLFTSFIRTKCLLMVNPPGNKPLISMKTQQQTLSILNNDLRTWNNKFWKPSCPLFLLSWKHSNYHDLGQSYLTWWEEIHKKYGEGRSDGTFNFPNVLLKLRSSNSFDWITLKLYNPLHTVTQNFTHAR